MPRKSEYKITAKGNVDILNAIRNDASQAFADAIPVANGDNIQEVGRLILEDQDYTNEFVMALVNRIGRTIIKSKTWNNPLKKFKEGLLDNGEVVQEIFVNAVEEKIYSMYDAESNVFKIAIPDIRACYYSMNSQKKYKATINESMLAQAFLSNNGLIDLVDKIMSRMQLQDERFEFLTMQNCIKTAGEKGHLYPVVLANAPSDEAKAKDLIKKIRSTYSKIKHPSTKYNFAGVLNLSLPEDIMLIIDSDLEAQVDVDVLAKAFNIEKTEFLGRVVVIPEMPIPNCYAILCDRNWWRVWDNKITTQSIYNPEGLYYNTTYHHWATYQYNPFENAIMFTTNASTITSVSLETSAINAQADTTVVIKPTIVATGNASKTLVFEATQNGNYVAEMTSNGVECNIRLRPDIPVGTQIKILAKSNFDESKNVEATITIIEPSRTTRSTKTTTKE